MVGRNGNGSTPYVRIAYVGGGSRGWAHTLMTDLALCGHLTGEVRLYDIDRPMALLNARWGRRVCQSPDARSAWRFTVPKTLAEALRDVDFVVASIQPGPIEMMAHDLGIPARYGIVHPVGDTVGPAGLCRCLRAVPQYAVIARAVARHCPDAWVINYTNPMSVCTRTLYKVFPRVKAFGCCHAVFGAQERLAGLLRQHHGVRARRHEVRLNVLGVNHFPWADRARYDHVGLIAL
ncbi:MAG: family 4 glycosyl hydrolase, partial [Planctomycetota bacterium]